MTGLFNTSNISFIFVFIEGLLSFFSPCVIPLIPIYMSYLAGNAKKTAEDGIISYDRKRVFLHTVFFILGVSFVFFILGMSFTKLGTFFRTNQLLFTRIGGIVIILLGLVQVGFLEFKFLQRERKLQFNLGERTMNPLLAFLMGFTFSFAWTPCVGPALSSVLIMASSSSSSFVGNLLVFIYALGFVIPFLALGLFTTQALNFLKKHQKLLKYTVKAGGILLILIGIMTFTGWMNGVSAYINHFVPQITQDNSKASQGKTEDGSSLDNASDSSNNITSNTSGDNSEASTGDNPSVESDDNSENTSGNNESSSPSASENSSGSTSNSSTENTSEKDIIPAYDFTLVDQYGTEHTLSDYKGKVVFLNFWATWCPPCKQEMPDIEALYNDLGKNESDVIVLAVANPATLVYPNNSDVTKEEIIAFLEENEYTFPVVFDETGEVLSNYYISAFPTTFFIDIEGNVFGYAPAMMTRDMMDNGIQQTIDSTK